jgi:hypothetical protein
MNAFHPTGPVFGPSFFGREELLGTLTSRIGSGQSIILLGERRIGKTSVLMHICRHRTPRGDGHHVLHDGPFSRPRTLEDVKDLLSRQLAHAGVKPRGQELSVWFDSLASRGHKLYLYLNDLDDLLGYSGSAAFAAFLRGTIEAGHVVVCATSYVPPQIREVRADAAPLSNVLYPITVAAFSEAEATTFLTLRSSESGDELTSQEIGLILDLVGCVPFYLQRVGWNLFTTHSILRQRGGRRLELIVAAIDEHFRALEPILQQALRLMPPEPYNTLVGAAKSGKVGDSPEATFLIQRGLLDPGSNPFRSLGSLNRAFLKECPGGTASAHAGGEPGWLGRLAEGAVQSLVDAAIKAQFGG